MLVLHCACVLLILPQESAIVSNTPSWRKVGFWYGSFPLAGAFEGVRFCFVSRSSLMDTPFASA